MVEPMERRSAQIAGQLEQEILAGKLPSGERLPSEEKLCVRFEASRTVIREAIQQLRGRGLLRSQKGSGTYIADPSLESLGSAIETYSVLAEEADFMELIDFRILIESECARLAARNAGSRAIKKIQNAFQQLEESSGDQESFSKADIALHVAIAEASGNGIYNILLGALEKRCIDFAQAHRNEPNWYERVVNQHRPIVDAIVGGQTNEAALAMRQHLLKSKREFMDSSY